MVRLSLRFFVTASVVPAVVYAALFEVINSVAYPPPMYTLMVMLLASSIPGHVIEILAGATLQTVLFAAINSYLLSHRVVAQRLAVWVPSVVGLLVAASIQVSLAGEAWKRQDYAGAQESVVAGFAVLLLVLLLALFGYRSAGAAAPRWAVTVNCLLHCAVVAVLFPYVGELP